jgi:cytochrome oxidase assembly protein ShyY1
MMLVLWLGLPLAVLSLGTWNLVRRTAEKDTDEDRTPR